MKVLAVLSVVLASMVVGCSLAADVTPPPTEEIAEVAVTATAEVKSAAAATLEQPETDKPSETAKPTQSKYVDWELFEDPVTGVSFRYPSAWERINEAHAVILEVDPGSVVFERLVIPYDELEQVAEDMFERDTHYTEISRLQMFDPVGYMSTGHFEDQNEQLVRFLLAYPEYGLMHWEINAPERRLLDEHLTMFEEILASVTLPVTGTKTQDGAVDPLSTEASADVTVADTAAQHPASNCQDLFPDAVEVPARHYLDNLEESWFRVLENNDTYFYVDPSGSVAKNGPWNTWFYEMAIQDVSSEFPEQFESVIAYGDHKVQWDEYLDYAQSVCDAYTSMGTRRSSQIALEKLINHDRHNNSHASRWEAFEYIDTGPSIIESPSPPGLEHYTKYITGGGVIIVGGASVPDEALLAARESVVYMTSARPDLREILRRNEVRISLFGPEGDTSVLPEFSDYNDRGGLAMSMTDASMAANAGIQCYPGNWGVGGNTVIHEMAHTLNHVVFEEINEIYFYERIYNLAVQAIENGIFPRIEGRPLSFTVAEYWAITIEGYIMNRPGFKSSHDTRDWIAENDPQLYELITRYYPTDEWIYCPGVEQQKDLFGPDHPYSQP